MQAGSLPLVPPEKLYIHHHVYRYVSIYRWIVGSCYITQGAQPRALLCDDLERWDGGGEKEAQEEGDMCIYVCVCVCMCVCVCLCVCVDSCCCTEEINTAL